MEMKIRYNKNFLNLLNNKKKVEAKISNIDFSFDIKKYEDFFLLQSKYNNSEIGRYNKDIFFDEIGYENFNNKISISYLFDKKQSKIDLAFQGIIIVKKIILKLKKKFPKNNFVIILSVDKNDCFVTFYKYRKNQNLLASDIEGYKEESIVEITV